MLTQAHSYMHYPKHVVLDVTLDCRNNNTMNNMNIDDIKVFWRTNNNEHICELLLVVCSECRLIQKDFQRLQILTGQVKTLF